MKEKRWIRPASFRKKFKRKLWSDSRTLGRCRQDEEDIQESNSLLRQKHVEREPGRESFIYISFCFSDIVRRRRTDTKHERSEVHFHWEQDERERVLRIWSWYKCNCTGFKNWVGKKKKPKGTRLVREWEFEKENSRVQKMIGGKSGSRVNHVLADPSMFGFWDSHECSSMKLVSMKLAVPSDLRLCVSTCVYVWEQYRDTEKESFLRQFCQLQGGGEEERHFIESTGQFPCRWRTGQTLRKEKE